MSYDDLLTWKRRDVDGVRLWMWPKSDADGVFETLVRDWKKSHKESWLKCAERRGVLVQAGGNCGLYPRLFADHFERVYTFEPDHLNFFCLTQNCMLENVIKMQAALGEKPGMVAVQRRWPSNPGAHRVVPGGIVPMMRIDDLGLDSCDFMQLDVEGFEFYVLLGAKETVRRFRPVISLESPGENVNELMSMYGYKQIMQTCDDIIFGFEY